MQKLDQPQTTTNPNNRNASVQISVYDKFDAIMIGIEKKHVEKVRQRPNQDYFAWRADINYSMVCELAMIIQHLTSQVKSERERGKNSVRELVKLGRKTASESTI